MNRPLDGVRIVAVEQYAAGPYGTQLLSELGAQVIKIEAPSLGGDISRAWVPTSWDATSGGDSQFFQTFSRGKQSVALEIKTPRAAPTSSGWWRAPTPWSTTCAATSRRSWRIRYDDLKAINPAIVCAHLSAYGRGNSREAWPGYDYLMQAEAGFMTLTGEPDGPPVRFGLSMVDFMTGSVFALGIVSAVLARAPAARVATSTSRCSTWPCTRPRIRRCGR
jgi:crotonobetainyl-CoA:carnitine CoA-transferase CaiB-like acyl-CoA transferase